ncbi:hypothetical protein SRB5_28210 [Streptomyces sp. RB5]|uniref:Uncharacterized protein n=1 Tax=Streptomyces smaragdinus TaxID=2585196 RepID=A0A7K0CIW1_9ACTN|nr:hypothetical protein [Streptomyces smaragdinus]MQY12684.1 hypothetical protein [Streptomyces smaragdinus]
MNGRKAAAAAALALGVLAASAAPVAGQEQTDARAYRTADGARETKGAASSADGPMLEAGEVYLDTIDPGEKLYYKINLDARSSTFVGVTAIPRPGDKVAYGDGFDVQLLSADNTKCGGADEKFGFDGRNRPLIDAAARRIDPEGDCQEAGVYNVLIERLSDPTSTPNPWTLELRPRAEPPVKSGPAAGQPQVYPSATPRPNTTATVRDIAGGAGQDDAVGMGDGVWKDKVLPGQTKYYRVPLDWGQSLSTYAEFGTAPVTDESAWLGDGVSVEYYSPSGWHIGGGAEGYNGREQTQVVNYTPKVDYANRTADDDINGYAYAGWYLVTVHVSQDVGDFVKGAVPVTLRTTIGGTAKEGPQYDGDAAQAGFGLTDRDRDAAQRGLTAAEAAAGSDTKTVIAYAGIGAGVLLLAGLGVWTLLARRGSPTAPVGALPENPYQQQPPGGGYGYPGQ